MTKILILDYVGNSKNWIDKFLNVDKIEVVNVIRPENSNQQRAIIVNSSWDYVLIFEQKMRDAFKFVLSDLQIQSEKIIYALDDSSWMSNLQAFYTLFKPRELNYTMIHRQLDFYIERRNNKFITCTTKDGLSYIATARDLAIMRLTYLLRENFAANDMEIFYFLAKRFYNNENNQGGGIF